MEKIHRVLIAEDQPLLRGGLCSMVRALQHYSVAGEAGDGVEACSLVVSARDSGTSFADRHALTLADTSDSCRPNAGMGAFRSGYRQSVR